jgi:5-methylcytosine-specific restriction endonuclease McrA
VRRELVELVRRRAGLRCEYCHFPEPYSGLNFQIDHVIAEKHGGPTAIENLALSCIYCNSYKGPNLSGFDSATGDIVPLFNPRQDE